MKTKSKKILLPLTRRPKERDCDVELCDANGFDLVYVNKYAESFKDKQDIAYADQICEAVNNFDEAKEIIRQVHSLLYKLDQRKSPLALKIRQFLSKLKEK